MVPEKIGLKGVTRENMDYEFTVVFDLDMKHQAVASKDRTRLFADKPQFLITAATGRKIMDWCTLDQSKDQIVNLINQAKTVEELKGVYLSYPLYQKELEDLFILRSKELQNVQPVNN
jgi:hypothetical protein